MTVLQDPHQTNRIAIVGIGSIGLGLTVVHARRGNAVTVCDSDHSQLSLFRQRLSVTLQSLAEHGLLDLTPETVLAHVKVVSSIEDAIGNADLVHECAPENLELKRQLFAEMDAASGPDTILASASSSITASQFAQKLTGKSRCLVAHPGNPPFLIPVIEIVPAPFTSSSVTQRAFDILAQADMSPVRLRHELPGFIFNRLQGAMLREAYCLVRDDVADVEDIDRIVRDGLGLRWSIIGPFETVDLNTRGGIERHAEILGPAYAAMGAERGQQDTWTPDLVAKVTAQRRKILSLEDWEERVRWRNDKLMELLTARKLSNRNT